MTLQSSGPISISQIKAERNSDSNSLFFLSFEEVGFGAPHSISEFYGYSAPPRVTDASIVFVFGGTSCENYQTRIDWSMFNCPPAYTLRIYAKNPDTPSFLGFVTGSIPANAGSVRVNAKVQPNTGTYVQRYFRLFLIDDTGATLTFTDTNETGFGGTTTCFVGEENVRVGP